jgi:hypothetical protein
MAVRTVTVEMRLDAASYLADGRAVRDVNNEMSRSFTRLSRDAVAANTAVNDVSRNVAQLGRRAGRAETQIRELREEIDRLTASAIAAHGPVNIINQGGPGGGRGGGGGGGMFGWLRNLISSWWSALPTQGKAGVISAATIIGTAFVNTLGAVIAGLLTAALGGVVTAGIGALAFSASATVRKLFGDLGRQVFGDLQGWSRAAVGPLIQSAGDLRDAWVRIGPTLNSTISMMAPEIRPLIDGIASFVERMLPGLQRALSQGRPVLEEMARGFGDIGESLGNFFDYISRGDGALKGMRFTVNLLAGGLEFLGRLIEGLAIAFDFMTKYGEKVTAFMSKIPVLGEPFKALHQIVAGVNDATVEHSSRALDATGAEADLASALGRSADKASSLDLAMGKLNEQMDADMRAITGLMDANIAYQQAIDDLTESLKEHGRNTDINTQKGRENVTAIEGVAKAAYQARDAYIEQNQETMGLAGATAAANAAFRKSIDDLAAQMRQAGLTEKQIHSLLDQWWALANAPNTAKSIVITTYYKTNGTPVTTSGGGPRPGPGDHYFNRYGGLYADQGLINLSGQARLFRPGARPTYGFAEQGTGGEAFVARNAPHGRSLTILSEAARWHGAQLAPIGAGGGSVANYAITVNAGIGADGAAVGRQVVAAIKQYEQRNGTSWRSGTAGSWR